MPGDPGVCTDIRTVITRTLDVSIRYYLIKIGNFEIYDDLSMRYDVTVNVLFISFHSNKPPPFKIRISVISMVVTYVR